MRLSFKCYLFSSTVYLAILQIVVYMTNYIIAHKIPKAYAGDYFTTIAVLNFLANIFILGGGATLTKNLPLFRTKYTSSFLANLINLSRFFFRAFIIVLVISIILDSVFYIIHMHHFLLWDQNFYHPAELSLFGVFIIICTNYVSTYLSIEEYVDVMFYCSTLGLFFQMGLFLLNYYIDFKINFSYDQSANLVLNYILFTLSGYGVALLLMAAYVFTRVVINIPKNSRDQQELYHGWRKELKYYILNALQGDWVIVSTIILEIFSANETDPAVFSYLFGIIGIICIVSKISKQYYQSYLMNYFFKNDFISVKRFIINNLLIGGLVVGGISLILIYYHDKVLNSFGVIKHFGLFFLLVICEFFNTLFKPALTGFLSFHSAKSLRDYTYLNTASYLVLVVAGIAATLGFQLEGMLIVFVICTFSLTIFEILLFLSYFQNFKQEKELSPVS